MSATKKLIKDTFNDFKMTTDRMDTFLEERCIEKLKELFNALNGATKL